MPTLDKAIRRIDQPPTRSGGAASPLGGAIAAAPPSLPTVAAPTALAVDRTAVYRSAVTPSALANLTWRPPAGVVIEQHLVQWDDDPTFASPVTRETGVAGAAGIDGLPAGVTVWFRVAAVAKGGIQSPWSTAISALMPQDTTPPAAPTGVAVQWDGRSGDAAITWQPSPAANLKHYRVRILSADGGTELHVGIAAGPLYSFTREANRVATAGAYAKTILVRVAAVSWGNVLSSEAEVAATLAPPAAPTGLSHSWQDDPGTADATLELRWTPSAAVAGYELALDGQACMLPAQDRYTYSLAQNRQEHSGNGDPVISYSLRARDALEQLSPPASGTATNAAPPAVTITLNAGFNTLGYTLGQHPARDADGYRVRLYRNGAEIAATRTYETVGLLDVANAGEGTYQADVAAVDLFGQLGPVTTSAAVELDPLTLAELRAGTIYRDDLGTTQSTLASLKDAVTTGGGVTYS